MRIALIALCLSSGLAGAQVPTDLDRPGVMDRIERENPERYAKISAILDTISVQPCETLPQVLLADFKVTDTKCTPFVLLASYPPKRTVTFQLDEVAYVSNVTVNFQAVARSQPVKNPFILLK